MSTKPPELPTIKEAISLIFHDNCIGRFDDASEDCALTSAIDRFGIEKIQDLDKFLNSLSYEDLQELTIGAEDLAEVILSRYKDPDFCHEFFEYIFYR